MKSVNQKKPVNTQNIVSQTIINNSTTTFAPLNKRVVAFIVDYVLITFLLSVIPYNLVNISSINYTLINRSVAHVIYFIILEGLIGQTFGKLILNIKVVDLEGNKILFYSAVIRNFLRIVDGFLFYLVAVIAINYSPFKQRIGDKIAKTLVVEN